MPLQYTSILFQNILLKLVWIPVLIYKYIQKDPLWSVNNGAMQ